MKVNCLCTYKIGFTHNKAIIEIGSSINLYHPICYVKWVKPYLLRNYKYVDWCLCTSHIVVLEGHILIFVLLDPDFFIDHTVDPDHPVEVDFC